MVSSFHTATANGSQGGLIFEGKCIFENKPPPQSMSCLLLKKGGGGGLIFGRIWYIDIILFHCVRDYLCETN